MDDEDELIAEEHRRVAVRQPSGELDFLQRFVTSGIGWVGRRLPKNVCELRLSVSDDPILVRDRTKLILRNNGYLLDDAKEHGSYRVRGMVHCGRTGHGRALVTVTVNAAGGGSTEVLVRGVSKEGLVKHYLGDTCAHLVADELRQPASEASG